MSVAFAGEIRGEGQRWTLHGCCREVLEVISLKESEVCSHPARRFTRFQIKAQEQDDK